MSGWISSAVAVSIVGLGVYTKQPLVTTVGLQLIFIMLGFLYILGSGWSMEARDDPEGHDRSTQRITLFIGLILLITCGIGVYLQFT